MEQFQPRDGIRGTATLFRGSCKLHWWSSVFKCARPVVKNLLTMSVQSHRGIGEGVLFFRRKKAGLSRSPTTFFGRSGRMTASASHLTAPFDGAP